MSKIWPSSVLFKQGKIDKETVITSHLRSQCFKTPLDKKDDWLIGKDFSQKVKISSISVRLIVTRAIKCQSHLIMIQAQGVSSEIQTTRYS